VAARCQETARPGVGSCRRTSTPVARDASADRDTNCVPRATGAPYPASPLRASHQDFRISPRGRTGGVVRFLLGAARHAPVL
jgi:hypothetical protein